MIVVDQDLLKLAQAGNPQAMESVLAQLAPALHRYSLRMCRQLDDADESTQDALLSVAQHLKDYEGRASLSSWAFTLARTACSRKRRGLKNQPLHSFEELSQGGEVSERSELAQTNSGLGQTSEDPESLAQEHELVSRLRAAIAALPADAHDVMVLRDVEGLSAEEAASALGLSVEALKSRLHRARKQLREALDAASPPRGKTPEAGPCPDLVTAFSTKLEGELEASDCAAMEAHLAECVRCAEACSALRVVLSGCRAYTTAPVPDRLRKQIRAALQDWRVA